MKRVALFTRAWIEIYNHICKMGTKQVALFTRAWIEIVNGTVIIGRTWVALFTRAWIEIGGISLEALAEKSPSLRGRGLKFTIL